MSEGNLGRREALRLLARGCAACLSMAHGALPAPAQGQAAPESLVPSVGENLAPRKARWWRKKEDRKVECGLCPRHCVVADIERGTCGVRENRGGEYYTLVHSRPCTVHLDPVEKKPLFHVLPGAAALSLASVGCNFECRFCQNWEIAQARPEQIPTHVLPPGELASLARRNGAPLIACTYTEPVVWAEYVYDIAEAGRKVGVRTVIVSNGYIDEEPLGDLCGMLAAVKVDLKAFSEKFYKETCRGEMKPVLDTLRRLRKKGMWTEIVVLVVPTLNDSPEELRGLARFVKNDLGPDVPLHFTAFHPDYRLMNLPSTPIATLERAHDIAVDEGLRFVYLGNVPGHRAESTYCPSCRRLLIRRVGYAVVENRLKTGNCPDCGLGIPGIWS